MAFNGKTAYIVGQLMDSEREQRLIAIDPKTAAIRAVRNLAVPEAIESRYPPQYLALAGNTAIVYQITENVKEAYICGFDFATGAHKWSFKTNSFSNQYTVDGGTVFATLLGPPARLVAIDAQSGSQRWAKEINSCCVLPVTGAKNVYVPTQFDDPPKITAINWQTGTVSWSVETEHGTRMPVAVAGATVYYSNTKNGLYGVWTSN